MPLPELVAQSKVIVVGRIVKVVQAWRGDEAFDIAFISVTEVLKDARDLTKPLRRQLPLIMPSTRDESMSTGDVSHDLGDQGVWFLSPVRGRYFTRYPDERQPMKVKARVKKLVEAAAAQGSDVDIR